MRSIVKKLLTLTLAILLVFSCIGCNKNNTGNEELDQWDYFNEFVEYSLYTTDATHKDYEAWQGWGIIKDTVYLNYSIKRATALMSTVRNLYELKIRVTENIHKIELQSFELDVLSVTTEKIEWNIYIGSTFLKTIEVNTVAEELVTLKSGFIGDIKWEQGSKLAIFLKLKSPNLIEPYIFTGLRTNIAKR